MKTFKTPKLSYKCTYCLTFMFFYVILIPQIFAEEQNVSKQVVVITIDGPIGPATSDYVLNGLDEAINTSAELVLLKMDTPGGLDTAMRDIIQGIISSSVPVVTFVSPSGARAASAGTYILYASHIAAMAPATTLGAATPVSIGGMPEFPDSPLPSDEKPMEDNEEIEQPSENEAMQNKIINDAAAYIRGLAQLRGRNEEWAEEAVRSASSLSAEEAIKNNVIDIIANSIHDLLSKLDNYSVKILGEERNLVTKTASINYFEPDWRNKLLSVITDPNILPILMTLGMFGLIYEMLNPGFVLPGVLGGICILLALYAAQVLPINYAGLALILLGILFMIGEAFVPSFGALGIGGVIAFVIGSIILIDTDYEGYGISIPFISSFALANALFFFTILSMVLKARHKPIVSGREELLGSVGEVIDAVDNFGRVKVHSENWQAKSNVPIPPGQKIRVTGIEGLTLIVEPEIYPTEDSS
ncbi:MAG: nodulation protein NfeD [Gammaproteobacteria bacterium]|nr:nodulation protein NfeD [Gammaproteobacteria bacterium]